MAAKLAVPPPATIRSLKIMNFEFSDSLKTPAPTVLHINKPGVKENDYQTKSKFQFELTIPTFENIIEE